MSLGLIQFAYQLILPPSGLILLLLLVNLYGYKQHWKRNKIFSIIILLFYLLSTRIGADFLAGQLEKRYKPLQQLSGDVLIMVGSGSISGAPGVGGEGQPSAIMSRNMLVTAQLEKQTELPVLVTGGITSGNTISEADIALRELHNLGILQERLYGEGKSRNTAENARNTAVICREKNWKHPILLADALHATRTEMFFRREGLDVTVYPTYYRRSLSHKGTLLSYIMPNTGNLDDSTAAIKEYLGILAVKLRLQ